MSPFTRFSAWLHDLIAPPPKLPEPRRNTYDSRHASWDAPQTYFPYSGDSYAAPAHCDASVAGCDSSSGGE